MCSKEGLFALEKRVLALETGVLLHYEEGVFASEKGMFALETGGVVVIEGGRACLEKGVSAIKKRVFPFEPGVLSYNKERVVALETRVCSETGAWWWHSPQWRVQNLEAEPRAQVPKPDGRVFA